MSWSQVLYCSQDVGLARMAGVRVWEVRNNGVPCEKRRVECAGDVKVTNAKNKDTFTTRLQFLQRLAGYG